MHEPPTYIRIVWEEGEPIDFYPSQRRYVRLETDANSNYYDPDNPTNSRINIIIVQGPVMLKGSTPLRGGRMRAILELPDDTPVGATGTLRVELSRLGLPTLSDQRGSSCAKHLHPAQDASRSAYPRSTRALSNPMTSSGRHLAGRTTWPRLRPQP
ncbi:MAG: hypothetical protein M5R38_03565 [Candidatus Methylomirabilis sp.]|nr:hypothetical protein [Candidatus Methylomirabilis sp.]